MISQFVGSSPTSGSVLTAQSLEPASDSLSPFLSLCPSPAHAFSLSKLNILKNYTGLQCLISAIKILKRQVGNRIQEEHHCCYCNFPLTPSKVLQVSRTPLPQHITSWFDKGLPGGPGAPQFTCIGRQGSPSDNRLRASSDTCPPSRSTFLGVRLSPGALEPSGDR